MKAAYPPPRPPTPSEKLAAWFYKDPRSPDAAQRRRERERYEPGCGPGVRGSDLGPRMCGPRGRPSAPGFTMLTPLILGRMRAAISSSYSAPTPGVRPGFCDACGRHIRVGSFFVKSSTAWRWYCPPCGITKVLADLPVAAPPPPLAGALYDK